MARWLKLLGCSLTVSSLFILSGLGPLLAQSAPDRTEIRKIEREEDINVQRHVGEWEIARRDQVLASGNWLATGTNSMAWMWYNTLDLIYRQMEDTVSRFIPGSTCGFRVTSGRNLFLLEGNRARCYQETENIQVRPPSLPDMARLANKQIDNSEDENTAVAFSLFRNPDAQETVVEVLASPLGPVTVTNKSAAFDDSEEGDIGNEIQLRAGEFAFMRDDGRLIRGEFSLQNFYENNPLTLGLGPSPEDQAYVDGLENAEEKKRFIEIREATLQALREQPDPGPFEVRILDEPNVNLPSPPECQSIGDQVLVCF